jgi:hypothetical protein
MDVAAATLFCLLNGDSMIDVFDVLYSTVWFCAWAGLVKSIVHTDQRLWHREYS